MASKLLLHLISLLLFHQVVFQGTTSAMSNEEILDGIRELYLHDPQALFKLMHVTPPVIVDPTAKTPAKPADAAKADKRA